MCTLILIPTSQTHIQIPSIFTEKQKSVLWSATLRAPPNRQRLGFMQRSKTDSYALPQIAQFRSFCASDRKKTFIFPGISFRMTLLRQEQADVCLYENQIRTI